MLKKKVIKRAYVQVAICDKCGSEMQSTGMCLTSYPAKYPYKCPNPDCDGHETFWEYNLPGKLIYEFEEESNDV